MKTIKKISMLIICFVLLFGQNAHNIKAEDNILGSTPDVGNTDINDENNTETEPGNTEPKPEEGTEPETGTENTEPKPEEGTEPETGTENTEPQPEQEKDILEIDVIEVTEPVLWTDVADTSWYDDNKNATEYTISTPEQLAGLAKLSISPEAGITASGDKHTSFNGKKIILSSNIDLSGLIWVPIGGIQYKQNVNTGLYEYSGSYVPFRGTFDGNGYSISNADIYFNSGDEIDKLIGHGLFGDVEGATIQNLIVENSKITHINKTSTATMLGLGILVGNAGSVTIENVSLVNNSIESNCIGYPMLAIGGFVGNEYKSVSNANLTKGVIVRNSRIDGLNMDVNLFTYDGRQTDNVMIGGAVGSFAFIRNIYNEPAYLSGIYETVVKNYNLSVKSTGDVNLSALYVGGLTGLIYRKANIINNSVESKIDLLELDKVDTVRHGGIAGFAAHELITGTSSIVSNAVKEELLTDSSSGQLVVGGIVGQNGVTNSYQGGEGIIQKINVKALPIIDCSVTIKSSKRLSGSNILTGNIIGYWDAKKDDMIDYVYNNISNSNFTTKENEYKLYGEVDYKTGATFSPNISKNWILEANVMKVNEAGEPITYRQVAEKTKEESIYDYYTPVYQADSMEDASDNKVSFGEVNAKTPLSITLNPVDTSSYISHTFNKDIRVVENIGEITGNVEGTDLDGSEVRIFHGNNEIAFKTTDASGKYTFTNIPYGIYNLEVKKGNRVIVVKIEIKQDTTTQNVKLPTETLNTEIVGNDANTVVEGIYDNFTDVDTAYAAEPTQSVKINFSANEVKETDETKKIIKELPKDMIVEQFIDMKLVKQNYKNNAVDGDPISLKELSEALTIYIPIPESVMASNDLITIYRYHEDATGIQVVEELPNNLTGDEGFEIDGNYIKLKSMKFSTYALVMKPNGYKVEFEFIGEVPTSAVLPVEQNVKAGEKIVEPTIRSISGYKFKGWFEDKSGTNKFNFKQIINSAKVLYGLWEKETSGGGGSPSRPDEPNVDEPSEPEVPEENPTVPEEPLEPEEPVETPNTDVVPPNTGYNSNMMLYLVIALSSAFIIFSILFDRRKKMIK